MNFESDSLAARRRKVVFYGRVSTEMEAQIAALKNQIIWYQQLAERHPEWTVVTMYEDEGISGRSINNRPGFMKMLTDAKKRKFDLIVTREGFALCPKYRGCVGCDPQTEDLRRRGLFCE